ncbi:zinc finger protein 19-like [Euwallacea fornicatus]|uniref:zinc finger protein 19-like n=1 Tax=Euwallacea fornicatus TaxID=995702 RepID=UPI00338FD2B6
MENSTECRTCLLQYILSDLIEVETVVIDQKNVLQGIKEVASIEVSETDLFPKHICHACFQALQAALSFRQQVLMAHIELKKRHEIQLQDPLFVSCDDLNGEAKPDSPCSKKLLVEASESEDEKVEIKPDVVVKNGDFKLVPETKFDQSDSDWDNNIEENASSEDSVEEAKVVMVKKEIKRKPLARARRVHRRKTRKKDIKHHYSSSENSDSDIPIENCKQEPDEKGGKILDNAEGSAEGPRLCPICGKLFKARQNYNSHMTTVHRKTDKPDKISCLCPDCGRVINGTRQNFVAHRRYHHSDKAQVKKRFTCDLCPRKFYREKNLIIHQRIHKGEKGYVCEICPDKSYTQIGGLILHRRKVHLKKPTCTCNYCGKQFYEKHYLETHIRQWHTGERPFSCEICGKAFSCNGTLLRHRKDSHGEKKPCPKCGKMYTEGELRKHLKRHKIREEGIKRKKYTCEYCGTEMNFTSRKRHLLKQHGIMLRGRGETAERVPVTRADAM